MLKRKVCSTRTRKSTFVEDLQQIALEKQQQHGELTLRVQQLEATIVPLQQQGPSTQGIPKEPKIYLPMKFDRTRSQFRGFLNQVHLGIQMHHEWN